VQTLSTNLVESERKRDFNASGCYDNHQLAQEEVLSTISITLLMLSGLNRLSDPRSGGMCCTWTGLTKFIPHDGI
jgi:hypothetical protein